LQGVVIAIDGGRIIDIVGNASSQLVGEGRRAGPPVNFGSVDMTTEYDLSSTSTANLYLCELRLKPDLPRDASQCL